MLRVLIVTLLIDSDLDDEIANDEELKDELESELSDAENEPPKRKLKIKNIVTVYI